MLYAAKLLSRQPDGSELDDQAFEPGAIYVNNNLFVEILNFAADWSFIDVHSGIYMLGTRDPRSTNW